jgi:hypothetical protein
VLRSGLGFHKHLVCGFQSRCLGVVNGLSTLAANGHHLVIELFQLLDGVVAEELVTKDSAFGPFVHLLVLLN